jgi:hypothetical protein
MLHKPTSQRLSVNLRSDLAAAVEAAARSNWEHPSQFARRAIARAVAEAMSTAVDPATPAPPRPPMTAGRPK